MFPNSNNDPYFLPHLVIQNQATINGTQFSPIGQDIEEEIQGTIYEIKDFQILSVLGYGGSGGSVEKVKHIPSQIIMAKKAIPFNFTDDSKKQILSELRTLRRCNSNYITKAYGSFINEGSVNILLEFMDKGTLSDLLIKLKKIPENILGMITVQILHGLEYLHKEMKVAHRDIKHSNILLNSAGRVKISDFGVAGTFSSLMSGMESFVGTIYYMSPERFEGKYHPNTDIWSLGIMLVECATGDFPFPFAKDKSVGFWKLLDHLKENGPPKLGSGFSKEFINFVAKCLEMDPFKRANVNELWDEPFMKICSILEQKGLLASWLSKV